MKFLEKSALKKAWIAAFIAMGLAPAEAGKRAFMLMKGLDKLFVPAILTA